jgi:OPA family hexose phosphate transport protein UhpT-like MFS transporter
LIFFIGLTGWEGTFAALDTSAAICIVLLLFVAIAEEKKIRHAKKLHLAANQA